MSSLKRGIIGAAGLARFWRWFWRCRRRRRSKRCGCAARSRRPTATRCWSRRAKAAEVTVKLTDNAQVNGVAKAALADIKQNSFVGITAMPQPDGTQKALEVHIFPEARRGAGEGHRPWDLVPNSTMTNANVEQLVTAVDGPMLTMKYKDGEKKISVPNNATIVQFVNGDRSELKPGAKIFIAAGTKKPDGTIETGGVNVGRDGVTPPM